MPPTGKDIEVRLLLRPDTKAASQAVRTLSDDVGKLSKASADARKNLPGGGGKAGDKDNKTKSEDEGPQGIADKAKIAGDKLEKLALKAVAVVAAFTAVTKAVGAGATAYYENKSGIGIADAVLKNTPIVSGAYNGIKGGMASTIYAKSLADASIQERYANLREGTNAAFTPVDLLKGQVKANDQAGLIRSGFAAAQGPNRAANRAAYGERFEDSFNQAEAEANKARRERDIAQSIKENSRSSMAKESDISGRTKKLVDEAKAEVKNAPNGAAEIAARSKLTVAESDYARQLENEKAASERHAKASLDAVSKLQESLQAETNLIAAKRDRAKALLDETKAGAASFLASTEEDKYMLAASLRQLKDGGVDSLAPEQKQQLLGNGLTGEFAKKELLKGAGNDPLLNSILQDSGRGTIADQEKQVQDLNAEIDAKIRLDTETIEEAFRKALADAGLNAEDISTKLADKAAREVDNKLQQNNLASGLGVR